MSQPDAGVREYDGDDPTGAAERGNGEPGHGEHGAEHGGVDVGDG